MPKPAEHPPTSTSMGCSSGPLAHRRKRARPAVCSARCRRVIVVRPTPMSMTAPPAAASALASAIKTLFGDCDIILVIGISSDKDIRGIGKELLPLASEVILTRANNPRALDPLSLKKELGDLGKGAKLTNSSASALRIALKENIHSNPSLRASAKQSRRLPRRFAPRNDMVSTEPLRSKEKLVCVSGSLFLVGEVLQHMGES